MLTKSLCKKSSKVKSARVLSEKGPEPILHQGNTYNLKELFDEVNERYFDFSVKDLSITWSKNAIRGARRCRRLGCFIPKKKLIRISTILDGAEIPHYFISFIVYHEILHHLFPPRKDGGKQWIHHAEFKAQEKKFSDYSLVLAWKKKEGTKLFFGG